MRSLKTVGLFASLLTGAVAVAPAADVDVEDKWSSPRRASGTQVVRPQPGSLPWDEQEWAHAPAPGQRNHYLFSPERMAEARAESYVSPDIQQGSALRGVASSAGPLTARAPARKSSFDGLKRSTSTYQGNRYFPPDTSVSAGPTKIIQATNVAIRMTNRGGAEIDSLPLNFFFGFNKNFRFTNNSNP